MKRLWILTVIVALITAGVLIVVQGWGKQTVVVRAEVKLFQADSLFVYYDTGKGFDEHVGLPCVPNEWAKLEFPIFRESSLRGIRLDLGGNTDSLHIQNLEVGLNGSIVRVDHSDNLRANCLHLGSRAESLYHRACSDPYLEYMWNLSAVQNAGLDWHWKNWITLLLGIVLLGIFLASNSMSSIKQYAIGAFFSAALFAHLIGHVAHYSNSEYLEKRAFAKFPERLDMNSFGSDINRWFNDHFSFRTALSKSFTDLHLSLFKRSPFTDKVVLGTNGHWFPSSEYLLEDITGKMSLTDEQVVSIYSNIKARIAFAQSIGAEYLLVFAPNKQSICTSSLPERYRKRANVSKTMMNQLVTILNTDLEVGMRTLDLQFSLRDSVEAYPSQQYYYPCDMHWNGHGAFVGYRSIIERLNSELYAMNCGEVPAYSQTSYTDENGDLARILLQRESCTRELVVFHAKDIELQEHVYTNPKSERVVESRTDMENRPKAVVFHDSFWVEVGPLVSHHFSSATHVWSHRFDQELLLRERPDVIIQEVAEMFIYELLPKSGE